MLYVDMGSVYAVGMYLACMCGLWNVLHIHMYYMYVLCMCAVYMCKCVLCDLCSIYMCAVCMCSVCMCVHPVYCALSCICRV